MRAVHILIFVLFAGLVLPSEVWGQGRNCDNIPLQANTVKTERDRAYERTKSLEQTIKEKKRIIHDYGGNPENSPYFPIRSFDQSNTYIKNQRKYKDDGGYLRLCDSWKNKDWGYIKDLREFKRDSCKYHNKYLEQEINRLDDLINTLVKEYAQGTQEGNSSPEVDEDEVKVMPYSVEEAEIVEKSGKAFRYCIFDPKVTDIRITTRHSTTAQYGFDVLDNQAKKESKSLVLAMNGGMFHPSREPVGLLIEEGQQLYPLNNRTQGRGNFYMKPNGVFAITNSGKAFVMPTPNYFKRIKEGVLRSSGMLLATQSGPLMVYKGKINPIFGKDSPNRHFRNAVGIREDGMVVFAISEQEVTFYELSEFLLALGCVNALYLDGTVSRMYFPYLSQQKDYFQGSRLGPLLYILE